MYFERKHARTKYTSNARNILRTKTCTSDIYFEQKHARVINERVIYIFLSTYTFSSNHRIEINQKVHSRRNLSQFHIELNKCSAVRYMFPSFKRTYYYHLRIFTEDRRFSINFCYQHVSSMFDYNYNKLLLLVQ